MNISLHDSDIPFLESIEEQSYEYCGDKLSENQVNSLRIGFININGIPDSNSQEKNHSPYKAMMKLDSDVVGLAEVNQHWQSIASDHTSGKIGF